MSDPIVSRWVGGYRLLRHLGSGGAGSVWEAEDGAGTRVAIKLLHPSQAADETNRARLIREVRLVNQISGPGVARVLDVETEDSTPFVVTELIEGPTLEEALKERPFTANETARLAMHLTDLLDRVHGAGVVHRDLKPANVILSENGPVLIDFGIAQDDTSQRLTQTGMIMGTPGYVSPELLDASGDLTFDVWRQSDRWALNALLLSTLTGEPPFGRGPWHVVMGRMVGGKPFTGGLPPSVVSAFLRALDPNPAVRGGTDDVISALTSQAPPVPQPTLSQPPTIAQPTFRPVRTVAPPTFNKPLATETVTIFGAILVGWMAIIPVLAGEPGWITIAVLAWLLSSLGAGAAWLYQRQKRHGQRPGEIGWTIAFGPRHLLVGAISLVPGAIAAFLVAMVLSMILFQTLDFGLLLKQSLAISDASLFSWISVWSALLVAYVIPTSLSFRQGMNLVLNSAFPKKWVKFLFGSLMLTSLVLIVISFS